MLTLNEIKSHCLSKAFAYEDFPFGPEPLVIKVGSKMFALISQNEDTVHISLKCDPLIIHSLREQYECVKPGYHLNKEHWNTVILNTSIANDCIPDDEIIWMINHSYELVYKKLTKAEKLNLEGGQSNEFN